MQQYVTLTIDFARVHAPKGTSVLDAALQRGICIPHLCHVPALSDIGACRLCVVEHVKNGSSKITTSCTLQVEEGMVIQTNSEKVLRMRRNIAELLVAEAPNSRAVQDIALRCGVTDVRYPFRNNDCVLCGRCTRFCEELWGAKALGFVGRGKERRVDFPFGVRPESCKRCGWCVAHCPMTETPCDGPMKPGEERLCGKCQSQLMTVNHLPGMCVACELGEGFKCTRYA